MKKSIMSVAFILALGLSQSLLAQDSMQPQSSMSSQNMHPKRFNISVNPLSLIFGAISANFDMKIMDKMTAGLRLGYSGGSVGDLKVNAYSVGVRTDFYLTGEALTNSFYVAPNADFAFGKAETGLSSASTSAFQIGALAGYKWFWGSGFNIGLGGGVRYITLDSDIELDDGTDVSLPSGLSGVVPDLEFSIGFAFH